MKTYRLYKYIKESQKDLNLRERFILIEEVKRCCPVIKSAIEDLVNGKADLSFGLTYDIDGKEVVLSVSCLIEDFAMAPLQAYIFLNWFTEEPTSAIDLLKRRDKLETRVQDCTEELNNEQSIILDSEI